MTQMAQTMNILKDAELRHIDIERIALNKKNPRRESEDSEEFNELVDSIRNNGLISPIRVEEVARGQYQIVDGNRRFKALRKVGKDSVPCIVEPNTDLVDRQIEFLIMSDFGKQLNDVERAYAILNIYRAAGYKDEQTIQGLMKLAADGETRFQNRVRVNKEQKGKWYPDERFSAICKRIPRAAQTQRKYLTMILNLSDEVLQYAEDKGLDKNQKILLTHKGLKNHPEIQKVVANKLKAYDPSRQRLIVNQTVRDIETGYLSKDRDGKYRYGLGTRDKIAAREIVKRAQEYHLEMVGACQNLLNALTGKDMERYTEKIIADTHPHRIEIFKDLGKVETAQYQSILELTIKAAKDALDVISDEWESSKVKNELLKP
jgi:ParB-like nuclease domain